MRRAFRQVDVFTTVPYGGNPVAVVVDGEGMSSEAMRRFAVWTNLSETTFVLPPTDPTADYRVRIFTSGNDLEDGEPGRELPFAGHPTLGSCHAWLEAGGSPKDVGVVVQECGAGLVRIRRIDERLAFAAPPPFRSGEVEEALVERVAAILGIGRAAIVDSEWAANGPNWIAVLLESAEAVLELRPTAGDLEVGVVGPYASGSPEAYEVRAFFPKDGGMTEDPVTGSLNAAVAQWLIRTGRATPPYVASQGTALGRTGRVHIDAGHDGTVWVGGGTVTCIRGEVDL